MNDIIVIYENVGVFNQVIQPLPSGVILGTTPGLIDPIDGRCITAYPFTEADIDYFLTIPGITVSDSVPADWHYEEC